MVNDHSLKALLEQKLDDLSQLWKRKDAAGILKDIYTPDAEVSGNDIPRILHGQESLHDLVSGMVEESSDANIEIVRMTMLSESTAYTWVNWDVGLEHGDRFTMKSLFVWLKTGTDWKIAADMYAEGEFSG